MREVECRTAFVTGGASGIGLAMARSFARACMGVAIADVEAPVLEAALDPAIVGDMVLDAVRNDDFWSFSHPGQRAAVQARHDAIVSSFDRWEQHCERLAAGEPGGNS